MPANQIDTQTEASSASTNFSPPSSPTVTKAGISVANPPVLPPEIFTSTPQPYTSCGKEPRSPIAIEFETNKSRLPDHEKAWLGMDGSPKRRQTFPASSVTPSAPERASTFGGTGSDEKQNSIARSKRSNSKTSRQSAEGSRN